jgi:hypothetical protein
MQEAAMDISSFVNNVRRYVGLCGLCALMAVTAPVAYAQGPGGPNGVDILIRAQNRSTADTPFCGVGGGMVGDRLDVDAFMSTDGHVMGTARFEDANGVVTIINIDRMFAWGNGILVQNQADQNTVPIWINDFFFGSFGFSPALLNVELPRGCGNTKSTFTPGVDKVTMQIRFR